MQPIKFEDQKPKNLNTPLDFSMEHREKKKKKENQNREGFKNFLLYECTDTLSIFP